MSKRWRVVLTMLCPLTGLVPITPIRVPAELQIGGIDLPGIGVRGHRGVFRASDRMG